MTTLTELSARLNQDIKVNLSWGQPTGHLTLPCDLEGDDTTDFLNQCYHTNDTLSSLGFRTRFYFSGSIETTTGRTVVEEVVNCDAEFGPNLVAAREDILPTDSPILASNVQANFIFVLPPEWQLEYNELRNLITTGELAPWYKKIQDIKNTGLLLKITAKQELQLCLEDIEFPTSISEYGNISQLLLDLNYTLISMGHECHFQLEVLNRYDDSDFCFTFIRDYRYVVINWSLRLDFGLIEILEPGQIRLPALTTVPEDTNPEDYDYGDDEEDKI